MDNNSSDGCDGIGSDSEFLYKAYAVLNIVMGLVACLFAVFALVVLVLFDKHLFYNQRLLIYLNISLFFGGLVSVSSVNPLLNDFLQKISIYCTINGFFYNWAILTQLMIIWLITMDIFRLSTSKNKLCQPKKSLERTLILVTFFLPPLVLWIPALPQIALYGPDGPLCDMQTFNYTTCKVINKGFYGLAGYRFVPFFISFTTLSVLLVIGTCKLHREVGKSSYSPQQREIAAIKGIVWQLQVYPFLYFIFSIPPIIHFIVVRTGGCDKLTLTVYFFYVVGNNVRTVLLSMAFLFNKDTRACLNKIRMVKAVKKLVKQESRAVLLYNDEPSLHSSHGDSLDAREDLARRKLELTESLVSDGLRDEYRY